MYSTTPNAQSYPENAVPFLRGVERGYDLDLRTPLFKGRDREEVAEQWAQVLGKHVMQMESELSDLESAQRQKIGSISRRKPFTERQSDVDAYYEPRSGSEYEFPEIVEMQGTNNAFPSNTRGLSHFPWRRLRPVGYEQAAYQLPMNTNSGLPHFRQRKDVLKESIAEARSGKYYPAMLGWRGSSGQTGHKYPKQRVVWMFSFSQNITEARYQSIMHPYYVKDRTHFAALESMEAVDREVTWMIDNKPGGSTMIATDYSKYDQTMRDQQSWFFVRMRNMFQKAYWDEISELEVRLRNVGLLCTENVTYIGRHGMPSGSNLTNSGDSSVNIDVQLSSPVVVGPEFQVQGDDATGRVMNVDLHLRHLERCGFEINEEKQYVSTRSTIYLQRLHHDGHRVGGICHGIYPTMRALNSLLGMERFHSSWDANMEALRTISILENTKWHPLFQEFVMFTVKFGDLYLKEFVENLDSDRFRKTVVRQGKSIPGFVPTYNQVESLTGIEAFETVRLIKSI